MSTIDNGVLSELGLVRQPTEARERDRLGQADFLKLMTTQLANQDPFKPMESGDFLAQLAQFGTVNGITELQKAFERFSMEVFSGQALQAASLIGREVLVEGDTALHLSGQTRRLAVEIPRSVNAVEVNVYAESGELVDTLRLGAREAGLVEIEWDGTDAQGNAVPTGYYRFEATLHDGARSEAASVLVATRVLSVELNRGRGMTLETDALGNVDFSSVRRIG